jgi:hypothetical protein
MPPKAGEGKAGRGGPTTGKECDTWKQQLKAELGNVQAEATRSASRIGELYVPNAYMSFYKTEGSCTHPEFEHGIDKITGGLEFDMKAPKDTQHAQYKRFNNGLQSFRPITSSQIYGWYRPLDQPKYGFGRSSLIQQTFIDRSHVGPSRPAASAAPSTNPQ